MGWIIWFGPRQIHGAVSGMFGGDDGWRGAIMCQWIGPSLFEVDITRIIPQGWMDALINLDFSLHWDLILADGPNTFTEWEVK